MSGRNRLRRQFASASLALMMFALVGCGSTANTNVGHLEGTVATEGGPSGATHPVEATVVATLLGGDPRSRTRRKLTQPRGSPLIYHRVNTVYRDSDDA